VVEILEGVEVITESTIYWVTRLDNIKIALGFITILPCVLAAIWFMVALMVYTFPDYDSQKQEAKEHIRKALPTLIVFFVFAIGNIFIPSTKEMCAIKIIPRIVNNEQVQELPNKIVELANEWIEELKPKSEDEK